MKASASIIAIANGELNTKIENFWGEIFFSHPWAKIKFTPGVRNEIIHHFLFYDKLILFF